MTAQAAETCTPSRKRDSRAGCPAVLQEKKKGVVSPFALEDSAAWNNLHTFWDLLQRPERPISSGRWAPVGYAAHSAFLPSSCRAAAATAATGCRPVPAAATTTGGTTTAARRASPRSAGSRSV